MSYVRLLSTLSCMNYVEIEFYMNGDECLVFYLKHHSATEFWILISQKVLCTVVPYYVSFYISMRLF